MDEMCGCLHFSFVQHCPWIMKKWQHRSSLGLVGLILAKTGQRGSFLGAPGTLLSILVDGTPGLEYSQKFGSRDRI
jgi:hypothetical protein